MTMDAKLKEESDRLIKEDTLAREKGKMPEQVQARRAVAEQFLEMHMPEDSTTARDALLAEMDYERPIRVINAAGMDVEHPKGTGFLGLGGKPAYVLSKRFPPKLAEDPIYALEYFRAAANR
jgi:hypothetical protein